MIKLEFTAEEYKELLEISFLGEFMKTKDIIPKNLEDLMSHPSSQLTQKLLKEAQLQGLPNLVEQSDDLPRVYINSDDLIDDFVFNE